MKPKSKAESRWRLLGHEYRHHYKQGTGAFRSARIFTRKQCSKAMRLHGKSEIIEGIKDTY